MKTTRHILLAALVYAGCEPASIADARDQLGREASGFLELILPVADTTYLVSEFLADEDTMTTATGLLGVRVQHDTVTAVDYAQFLVTDEVSTVVAVPSPAAFAPGAQTDTLNLSTPQGSQVMAAQATSGYVVRVVTNNSGCAGTVSVNVRDGTGGAVLTLPDVFLADGANVLDSVSVAGAAFTGLIEVSTAVGYGGCTPDPLGSVSSTITVRPLVLASVTLTGVSETIAVERVSEIDPFEVDFSDLEDAIRQSTLNDATVAFEIANSADMPVVLDSFVVGAVRLDAGGQPLRTAGGEYLYELDGSGAPLVLPVTDPGASTLTLARGSTSAVYLAAAPLVDRIVHLVLDDQRVAFVATGRATGGDGTLSSVVSSDDIELRYEFMVGLDFTVPPSGVGITRNQVADGFDLSPEDADDLVARLAMSELTAIVLNHTPFSATVQIALAPDSLDDDIDVFAVPGAVLLDPISLAGPAVDASGTPLGAVTDTVVLALTGDDVRVALEPKLTAGIRIGLMPDAGGGGRGAVRPTDGVAIDARIRLQIRRGGQQ